MGYEDVMDHDWTDEELGIYKDEPKRRTIMEPKQERALFERLQRIESRVVRGFTELGVPVCDDEDWIRVDNERHEVHMKGTGRSIKAVQLAIRKSEGYSSGNYTVLVQGQTVATVVM